MKLDSDYDRSILVGLTKDLDACYANLTATQTRCSEMLQELRHLRLEVRRLKHYDSIDGLVMRGWNCPICRVFNGEEKTRQETCRSCDVVRPPHPGLIV